MEQPAKARKCYMRALNVGDQEDIAMIRLARVCETLKDDEGKHRLYLALLLLTLSLFNELKQKLINKTKTEMQGLSMAMLLSLFSRSGN